MADIIHRIGIKVPAAKVYDALATIKGLAGWWTEETLGTSKPGGVITFTFRSLKGDVMGAFDMEVVGHVPGKKVQWKVKDGPEEWVGTDLTFDLKEEDGMTILLFGHKNWKKPVEFMAHCSMKWAVFLLSLRELVETGKGRPSPRDLKIDNWN